MAEQPGRRQRKPLKQEDIIAALHATGGVVVRAAKRLGVAPNTLRARIEHSDVLTREREGIIENTIDLAEDGLLTILKRPSHRDYFKAVQFYLRTLGRNRGYNDQVELSVTGDNKPKVVVYVPQKAELPDDGSGSGPVEPDSIEPPGD